MFKNSKFRLLSPLVVVLLGLCAAPGVAAETVCFTAIDGTVQCSSVLSYSAKIAIWCSILGSVALGLGLYIFLSCRRRRKQAIYNVEAGQIHGPSLGGTFDPRTATLSATYPKTPKVVRVVSPGGTPRSSHFATAQQESLASDIVKGWPKPPQTAPVSQSNAYYPFPGYSPKAPMQQPHTAFSGKFPRTLYTGQPVKREVHREWV